MKRTIENCSLIKRGVRKGIGEPETQNGKCLGYAGGSYAREDDEPCEKCKACKLNSAYDA